MITPIRTMTINQIVERKDELLMSDDDIKELAKNERAKAIDEFAKELLADAPKNYAGEKMLGGDISYISANKVEQIAEQLKGGAK